MSRFHSIKRELHKSLSGPGWENMLDNVQGSKAQEYVAPLISLLPRSGELHWRAIRALGLCVASIAASNIENGRTIMRRLMWHMNEESGNLGWGIPESMGEILSHSDTLAAEFNRILFSYVMDTGRDDNFIDHAPLLRSCFWGAGRLAQARPDYGMAALPSFLHALGHQDSIVCCQAALALCKLLEAAGAQKSSVALAQYNLPSAISALENLQTMLVECEDFDGKQMLLPTAKDIASRTIPLLGL